MIKLINQPKNRKQNNAKNINFLYKLTLHNDIN